METMTGTTARDVVATVRAAIGVTLELEHTGGNCAALVGKLETGHVLVVSDGDVLVYDAGLSQEMWEGINAAIYSSGAWSGDDDDTDPLVSAYNVGTGHAEIVRSVREALEALLSL